MKRISLGLMVVALWLMVARAGADVWSIDVEGAIGPATADHLTRGLQEASEANAELVLLRIDTPGGLDLSMREMIKDVLASDVPVVGFVAPSGARAASAGTYLLYATHVAAMAPGTNLGAATPVQIGTPRLPSLPKPEGGRGEPNAGGEPPAEPATAMERKIVNDAVAYIQSLAQLRERNAQWAEKAVRQGASLSAEDALAAGVIDLVADSTPALLSRLHGRTVVVKGAELTLHTEGLAIQRYEVDWRSEFLSIITNPNVAYILMLVGVYGLIIEFYNPGIGVPGVLGAVCLLLAMYAFQVLPISYAGLGLILLGLALMTAEAFAPSFGILGLGGIAAFIVGSVMLMDTQLPAYQIALPMILALAVFSAGLLAVALGLLVRARKQAVVTGVAHLVGAIAPVEALADGVVWVRLDGELWEARSDDVLAEADSVIVEAVDELTLQVKKQS
ncbi:MAG: nodulation protein NfeD [Halioglobus sp.]